MAETTLADGGAGSLSPKLRPPLLRSLAGLGLLAGLGYFMARGGNFAKSRPDPPQLGDSTYRAHADLARCGPVRSDGRPVAIEMLYSSDKRAWVEPAADRFAQLCPNIQVKLSAMEDIAAAQALLSRAVSPAVWSPVDELSLRYLDHRQGLRPERPPLAIFAKTYLVESPLVLLIWEDRLRVLSTLLASQPSAEGQWMRTLCALIPRAPSLAGLASAAMVPGTWADWYASGLTRPERPRERLRERPRDRPVNGSPSAGQAPPPSLAELQSWGPVKIGTMMPTRYVTGAAVLYLLALDYVLPPWARQSPARNTAAAAFPAPEWNGTEEEQLARAFADGLAEKRPLLQTWLRRCQAGQSAAPMPESSLAESLFNLGPSQLDAVVSSEHGALPWLDRIDAHAESGRKLAVFYPKPTLVFRHPAVLLAADPERQAAAQKWLEFLRSEEMQELALTQGFRPVHPAVSVPGHDTKQNPFLRLRRYGVEPQPELQTPPDPSGRVIQELMTLWGDASGRF